MNKINYKEYEILKSLDNRWKWIARDYMGRDGGNLFAHSEKPYKDYYKNDWSDGSTKWLSIDNYLFQFIQWQDEDPYNIQELIEGYEKEREETEVKKDIEWAIKEIEGLETESSQNYPHDEMIEKEIVLGILSQLDELGVLSQEWIRGNIEYAYYMTPRGTYSSAKSVIDPDKLKNLLVLNQEITEEQAYDTIAKSFPATAKEIKLVLEKYYSSMLIEFSEELHESIVRAFDVEATSKTIEMLTGMTLEQIIEEVRESEIVLKKEQPVVPKYVADWISKHSGGFDLYPALKRLENNALSWDDVYEWYRGNTSKFVNAYLTGEYKTEEQKYYVLNKTRNSAILVRMFDEPTLDPAPITEIDEVDQFTEQEIKDYDDRFWPFAVKVEELERE